MIRKPTATDIVIVGDGLAGLVMALSVAAYSPCTLVGPGQAGADDGRTTAIMQDGVDFLTRLNVWDETALQAVPLKHMRLFSQDATINFPSTEIDLPQFGFNVANAPLKDKLSRHIASHPAINRVWASVTDVTFPARGDVPHAHLNCAGGETLTARLVIAADGKNSLVRQRAGIAVHATEINQSALVCVVEAALPHDFTSTEWYHSGGPFTLVPMPGGRMGVVYCDTPDRIAELAGRERDALGDYFTDVSRSLYGNLRLVNDAQIWPVTPQHSAAMTARHVALIGEAAHVMPPLAAQGFNTSLRDIQALQTVLADAMSLGLDIGHPAVLQHYDTLRRFDMRLRGTGVQWLNSLIRRDDRIGRRLHSWGFKAATQITPLKKMLMRAALAPRASRADKGTG